jgi:hypothetical protein
MGVRPAILNPENVSRCDGPYDVGRCRAADTSRKATNRGVLFELLVLGDSEAYQCTLLYNNAIKYTVLHCTILYYTVPNSTVLCYTIIQTVVLCYTKIYYIILYYTILYYGAWGSVVVKALRY